MSSAVKVRKLYGQSYKGVALFLVSRGDDNDMRIDAASAKEAEDEARRRWRRIDAERAGWEAAPARRRDDGFEDWPELAAAMWEVLLRG